MKIIHIVDSLLLGGLEKMVVDLAMEQKKRGNDVTVVSITSGDEDLVNTIKSGNIFYHELGKSEGFDMRTAKSLIGIIKTKRPDVVHTHNPVANFYGAICGRIAGTKKIINTRHGMGNYPYDKKRESLFKLSTLFTDKVAFVCDKAKNNFMDLKLVSPRKSIVVHNGIPVEKYGIRDNKLSERLFEELQIDKGEKIVTVVARLNKVKDIRTLLYAAENIFAIRDDIRVIIVGDGPEMEDLRKATKELSIDKKVYFAGKRNDVSAILDITDIFVLPSVSEGMSLTLIEAMSARVPVIATDVGGNPEVVKDGETGLLIEPKRPEILSKKIQYLLDNKERSLEMGLKGYKMARNMFSTYHMADSYQKIYV